MEPLRANSWTEATLYLKVTACTECGQGPWELDGPAPPDDDAPRRLHARCVHCDARRDFLFQCDRTTEARQLESLNLERINPDDEPSRIIDLGQWLSLFYTLADSAAKADDKTVAQRLTFQAAQCLDEALKFYAPDDDLPPESALFTERSRRAFAEHTEKFARENLRLMRRKLPDVKVMIRRLTGQPTGPALAARRWWQFWK